MTFSIVDVSHKYVTSGYAPTEALRGIEILDIHPGEIILIMGPNGSGKTTLIDKLAGRIVPCSDGKYVTDDGTFISPGDQRRFLHLSVPQMPMAGFVPALSVLENILLREKLSRRVTLRSAIRRSDRSAVQAFLNSIHFPDFVAKLDQLPEALSGGQQQLLNLVGVIYAKPELLLLDEPTSKLDPVNRVRAWQLIVTAAKSMRISVLCATHDTESVSRVADRLVELEDGRVVMVRALRRLDAPRFAGTVRKVRRCDDLEARFRPADDWWQPGQDVLFGDSYRRGDASKYGYLADRSLAPGDRTRREVEGSLALLGCDPTDIVLDSPCGWGRHSLEIAKSGHSVVGGDLNIGYLSEGRAQSSPSACFVRLDLRALPFANASVGGILCLWTSFGFFDDDGNRQVFSEWARVLRSGGKLVIHSDLNPRRVRRGIFDEPPVRPLIDGGELHVEEFYCEEDQRVYGCWTVRRELTTSSHAYSIALYSEAEMRTIADEVGLDLVGFYGSFDPPFLPLTDSSQEFIAVFQKR